MTRTTKKPTTRKPSAKKAAPPLKPLTGAIEVGDNCGKCRFFLPEQSEQGFCRRYPATPMLQIQGGIISTFPTMMDVGWCGEFSAKDA